MLRSMFFGQNLVDRMCDGNAANDIYSACLAMRANQIDLYLDRLRYGHYRSALSITRGTIKISKASPFNHPARVARYLSSILAKSKFPCSSFFFVVVRDNERSRIHRLLYIHN